MFPSVHSFREALIVAPLLDSSKMLPSQQIQPLRLPRRQARFGAAAAWTAGTVSGGLARKCAGVETDSAHAGLVEGCLSRRDDIRSMASTLCRCRVAVRGGLDDVCEVTGRRDVGRRRQAGRTVEGGTMRHIDWAGANLGPESIAGWGGPGATWRTLLDACICVGATW